MFGRFGPLELVLVLVIALLIFGPKKLPEIGKAIGNAIRNFRSSANKLTSEEDEAHEENRFESDQEPGGTASGNEGNTEESERR
jgi:sec-independent protein translocase protein TatA